MKQRCFGHSDAGRVKKENEDAILMAVEEQIGLGFVPKVTVQRYLPMGMLKIVEIEGVSMKRWLYLVDNSQAAHSPAANAFWAYVDESAQLGGSKPAHNSPTNEAVKDRVAASLPSTPGDNERALPVLTATPSLS